MGLADRLKQKLRTFMQRPGTTVSLDRFEAILPRILEMEDELTALTDAEFTARAIELREIISKPRDGQAAPLAEPLPIDAEDLADICATGREAGRRALGERAFDVQLLGAMAMLQGNVVEMATGEGKTLAAVIAAYGYVVRGSQVQVLTANDYLADRDARWMGPVYRMLGLSVGSVGEGCTHDERAAAYRCDVTYVSVSEAGFDFLRDQQVLRAEDAVMPGLYTVIVDEADSILIDEARVPLVVAGSLADATSDASAAATLVAAMRPGRDFEVIDDGRNVQLTDVGAALVERAWGGIHLYAPENLHRLTAVNLALHARTLLSVDVDYIVKDGRIALVDEFRGRVARRRRWPDGLQAAVEAKEGLAATDEGEILATITVQAFIALYPTVAGMTGTAATVGDELREFYRLEVAVIPPNTPNVRVDEPDRVYATIEEKEEALAAEVAAAHETGRPVLVGTLDVAESERLAALLQDRGIACTVLNAKNDAHEAAVIAEAGGRGAVTVSTQMAGRGTDIRLGGSDGADRAAVAELGGLYVIGAGRHDSRRVDDQLRGRAGRQGDPGGSVFFVSREDELIVRHGDGIGGTTAGDGRVTGPHVDWAVGHAQRVAEGVDFEIHRNTWRYGVLIERQRQVLARRRTALLTTDAAAELLREGKARFPADRSVVAAGQWTDEDGDLETVTVGERYAEVVAAIGEQAAEEVARQIALHHLDRGWADHLGMLANVRDGVHLRALGRQDPLDEFHRVAVPAFQQMLDEADADTAETFMAARIERPDWTPADAGLERPSATWTYMVHDNPFGSEIERLFGRMAKALLGR